MAISSTHLDPLSSIPLPVCQQTRISLRDFSLVCGLTEKEFCRGNRLPALDNRFSQRTKTPPRHLHGNHTMMVIITTIAMAMTITIIYKPRPLLWQEFSQMVSCGGAVGDEGRTGRGGLVGVVGILLGV